MLRRSTPDFVFNFLLERNILLKAGDGTNQSSVVVDRYEKEAQIVGGLKDKIILEFGYGGSFGTAVELLRRGAGHVYLLDKFARPNNRKNKRFFELYSVFFVETENGSKLPKKEYITIVTDDIDVWSQKTDKKVDIVFSSSVLEHVADVDQTVFYLKNIMATDGFQCHFVDISDHFHKFPFEMYCWGNWAWNHFLNPGINLNRLRTPDYFSIFKKYFDHADYKIIEKKLPEFLHVKRRFLKKYLLGDDNIDAATQIIVIAF